MGYEESLKAMEAGTIKHKRFPHKFAMFIAILGTNMITYYIVSTGGAVAYYNTNMQHAQHHYELQNAEYYRPGPQQSIDDMINRKLYGVGARSYHFSMPSPLLELTNQLNQTQLELVSTEHTLIRVQKELKESMERYERLHAEMLRAMELIRDALGGKENMLLSSSSTDDRHVNEVVGISANNEIIWAEWERVAKSDENLVGELQEFVAARKLPLGWSSGLAADNLISPIGHACAFHRDSLQRYMEYDVGGKCPDDQNLAQKLLLHGCEPLPRRRCFARSPENFTEPYPFPKSLWTVPPNNNIHWSAYTCKSFECLNMRNNRGVSGDCLDCFELSGREKGRWVGGGGVIDFTINEVLALKNGTIRIGLDIGGGTGSFAVRMKENDVTIITTTMNFDGPFNNMIALRGMVPMYMSIAQRLPFFDNTLDMVHSMHVLSNWIPTHTLEFLMFDIDRILRPGGVFWLDRFFCRRHELTQVYVPLIEKLGYKKLKWGVGNKLDRGADKQEVYLSAVLEKPHARLQSS